MGKLNAKQTLINLIRLLVEYLDEFNAAEGLNDNFVYGEKTAYVECLEIILYWDEAEENGLNFNVEERYPI